MPPPWRHAARHATGPRHAPPAVTRLAGRRLLSEGGRHRPPRAPTSHTLPMPARNPSRSPEPLPFPGAARRAAAFLARGDELRPAGHYRLAAECYRQAIAYDGACAAAHLGLGLVLWAMNRPVEAIARLEEAVALDPRGHEAARCLAQLYAACGHPAAARKYAEQAAAAVAAAPPVDAGARSRLRRRRPLELAAASH